MALLLDGGGDGDVYTENGAVIAIACKLISSWRIGESDSEEYM